MNRRAIALLLAVAMTISLCVLSAFAAGQTEDGTAVPAEEASAVQAPEETGEAEAALPTAPAQPDPVGVLSFENLEGRLRENNYNLLALYENVASIEVLDYDKMYDSLKKQLNEIADYQWMLIQFGQGNSYSSAMLAQNYSAVRDTFDAIKDGELQQDNADIVRQLRAAENQVVMAAESLYVALLEMDLTDASLGRSLDTLERSIQEMELRYDLGQISALTLQQVTAGRTSLVSGRQTLAMNRTNYTMQLELMVGAELTGEMKLGELPEVSDEALAAMDLETDLAEAKAASYSLYAAELTLQDAEEDYKDAAKKYHYDTSRYQLASALHTCQAAQYTYSATVQNFEMAFRTLYFQVKDYQQVLAAARTALSCERDTYASMELKYQQGSISHNALLDAADKVSAAEETVEQARLDLFSAYNTYRWAVEHGILN